jgi:hypothetical protein
MVVAEADDARAPHLRLRLRRLLHDLQDRPAVLATRFVVDRVEKGVDALLGSLRLEFGHLLRLRSDWGSGGIIPDPRARVNPGAAGPGLLSRSSFKQILHSQMIPARRNGRVEPRAADNYIEADVDRHLLEL